MKVLDPETMSAALDELNASFKERDLKMIS